MKTIALMTKDERTKPQDDISQTLPNPNANSSLIYWWRLPSLVFVYQTLTNKHNNKQTAHPWYPTATVSAQISGDICASQTDMDSDMFWCISYYSETWCTKSLMLQELRVVIVPSIWPQVWIHILYQTWSKCLEIPSLFHHHYQPGGCSFPSYQIQIRKGNEKRLLNLSAII